MRLFVLIGSLLVLALLAALIVPPYVDWNQYKTRFEQEASRLLGQRVEVRGETSVRLLPLPKVTFNDVQVGELEDGKSILSAESFRMDVELAPLLKGDVVVAEMEFTRPMLDLRLDAEGRFVWPEPRESNTRGIGGDDVSLQNIRFVEGAVRLRSERLNKEHVLSDIDATASARTLSGPWRINGTFSYLEERVRVALSTGLVQSSNSLRVKVQAEPQSQPYDITFDGPLTFADSVPKLEGILRIQTTPKQNDEDLIVFRREGIETALPIRLEGDVLLATSGGTVPAFKLDIGAWDDPYTITGTGQAIFGDRLSFQIQAEGKQINVRQFERGEDDLGSSLSTRLQALRETIQRMPRFTADGEISLFLPAIVAGDTVVRDVGMDIRPAATGSGWELSNLKAQLPGRTELRADGLLEVGEQFGYRGGLIVASKQPSGLAAWLGSRDDPVIREMTSAGFSAKAELSNDGVVLNDLEIRLDGQMLRGNLLRDVTGRRPTLAGDLTGERVELDQLKALAGIFAGRSVVGTASGHDLNIKLNADEVVSEGVTASKVTASVRYTDKILAFDQLDVGDLAGAAIGLKGELELGSTSIDGNLSGSLKAEDLSRFLALVNKRYGKFDLLSRLIADRGSVANADLKLQLDGAESGADLTLSGALGGSEVEVSLKKLLPGKSVAEQNIDGRLVLVNDETSRLLMQLGLPVIPIENSGRGAVRITATGSLKSGLKTEAALTTLDGFVSLAGSVEQSAEGKLSGVLKLRSETQDTDKAVLLSGLPVSGFGNLGTTSVHGEVTFADGRYSISDLQSKLGDVDVTGALELNTTVKPRPRVQGAIVVSSIEVPMIVRLVHPEVADPSNATEETFAAGGLLTGLDGAIKLTSPALRFGGRVPDASGFSANLDIVDGDLTFDAIGADWVGGSVEGRVTLAKTLQARLLSGQLSLKTGEAAQLQAITGFQPVMTGRADINATFESAAGQGQSLLNGFTASGLARVVDGNIKGLNGSAFGPILASADIQRDDALDALAPGLVEERVFSDTMAFEPVEIPFNVGSGVLRASNVQLKGDATSLSGNARYDIANGTMALDVQMRFEPGKQAVVGASPELRFSLSGTPGNLKRSNDVSQFSTFLGMRLSEQRERNFVAQQDEILERQRLRRQARMYALADLAERAAEEEKERVEREKEAQLLLETQRKALEAVQKERQLEELRRLADDATKRRDRELKLEMKDTTGEVTLEAVEPVN